MPDAIAILSYGGPHHPDEVVPFLRNATKGRNIPDERLKVVGEHYYLFGGKSPINELNAGLARAITDELQARGIALPVVVGNRNWEPYVTEVFQQLKADGYRDIVALPTAAYDSYSSAEQYQEDIDSALETVNDDAGALRVSRVQPYFNTVGFVEPNAQLIDHALEEHLAMTGHEPRLHFITHSIPTKMNEESGRTVGSTYDKQHEDVANAIVAMLRDKGWKLDGWEINYCSRSGSPHTPWLEPDVNDRLDELAFSEEADALLESGVLLAPIGFLSDHMEVIYDLDTQAKETCENHGIPMTRASTVGTHPTFVSMLVDLLETGEPASTPLTQAAGNILRPQK